MLDRRICDPFFVSLQRLYRFASFVPRSNASKIMFRHKLRSLKTVENSLKYAKYQLNGFHLGRVRKLSKVQISTN